MCGARQCEEEKDMTILGTPVSMDFIWGVICACVAGAFAYWRFSAERVLRRAERLENVLKDLNRKEIAETFYRFIEGGEKFYDCGKSEFLCDSERVIDYMLGRFSYLCYLRSRRVLGSSEFSEFAYQIERTISNGYVQAYIYDLYVGFEIGDARERPFGELVKYGMRIGNERMREIYREFTNVASSDEKRRLAGKAHCSQEVENNSRETEDRSEAFKEYLRIHYSKKSADTIFCCAKAVEKELGGTLDDLTNDTASFNDSVDRLSQLGGLSQKRIGNLRHALRQFWIYRNR